jgi:hypothetical protein
MASSIAHRPLIVRPAVRPLRAGSIHGTARAARCIEPTARGIPTFIAGATRVC